MAPTVTTEPTVYTSSRPVWAEVDLDAIRQNIRLVRNLVGPQRGIMAVVKADAYGHGMIPIARAAIEASANTFGVATTDEALELRETAEFRHRSILIMAPTIMDEVDLIQRADLGVSVGSIELLRAHLAHARKLGKHAKIHIQVDTGIGRDGFRFGDYSFLDELTSAPGSFEGIFTHFSTADGNDNESKEFTKLQIRRFDEVSAKINPKLFDPLFHIANSGAILLHPEAVRDFVRPGIMMYGNLKDLSPDLAQAMTLKARIASIYIAHPGDAVSYGRTWRADKTTRIGIIPLGYGDGYMRCLSNIASVLLHGRRAPIRGRVCMDQFMIDLGDFPEAKVGDEVVLFGRQGDAFIPIEEIASLAKTITYEVTCSLTPRVPRIYINQ